MHSALVACVFAVLVLSFLPARAQSQTEVGELNQRIGELRNAGKLEEAIPLAQRYAEAIKARHGEHAEYATALSELAQLLQTTDRLTEAEPLLRHALAIRETSFGSEHPQVSASLNALALLLLGTNRMEEAESLLHRAIEILEKSLGPEHPDLVASLNSLALLLLGTNRLVEAEPLYRRGLAILEKSLGPDHPDVATSLSVLAWQLQATNRPAEAEALYRRALSIVERSYGPEHLSVGAIVNAMALLCQASDRLCDAEPLFRRALVIFEKNSGPEHPDVATILNNLARLLQTTNRLAEAEPLYRRALAITEKSFGPEHPQVAAHISSLAGLLKVTVRLADAELLFRRALAILEKNYGSEHPDVASNLNNLAAVLQLTDRLDEAEPLMRRALAITEMSYGPEHPTVATMLNDLAMLLQISDRLAQAESVMRRALAIVEKSLGPDHPEVAASLSNLARLLHDTNRLAEAEPLHRRALAIYEKNYGPDHFEMAFSLSALGALLQETNRLTEAEPLLRQAVATLGNIHGPEHPAVAASLNVLASLLQATNRLTEAEPLLRRALAVYEKTLGPEYPAVGTSAFILAQVLQASKQLAEAEPLMRRALAIYKTSYGPKSRAMATGLNALAELRAEAGDWAEAVDLYARAKPILTGRGDPEVGDRGGLAKAALVRNTNAFRAHARAAYRADPIGPIAREEGFELAQWALQTGAADALAQMSVRFTRGSGPLAVLVRERQDLITRRQGEDKRLLTAVGKADAPTVQEIRSKMAALDSELDDIDKQLAKEFPEYANLATPQPLTIAAVRALLRPNEALVVFLDVPQFGALPEETLAWALTKTESRSISIPLGTSALSDKVATLRCGLDREGLWSWAGHAQRWLAKGEHCRALEPNGLGAREPLPFDLAVAHQLYDQLLKPFADLTKGKSLIVVPSGPLTSLPFHVLVTGPPATAKGGVKVSDPQAMARNYRAAMWLALRQPITMLPSVGSLQALRKLPPSQAKERYIAFGNPLLDGGVPDGDQAKLARSKQRCPQHLESGRQRVAGATKGVPAISTIFRGGSIDLDALRAQAPLPETADELCAVAKALGVLGRERDTVWLGARATETNLKALSRDGKLARYQVLHFATHGLLAGESEAFLKAKAEPALMLTPPKAEDSKAELEIDNGLLMASEVAQLELDADWVVLSACNTAAGEQGDAEALSGLARAFFYAKARALLVSHWYVLSEPAVKLTTTAFAELRDNPRIGRAEALRRSMAKMITEGKPEEAHPEHWAPFVLVGEGGS